jgi:uncharacterized protein (DUF58 family)
MDRSLGRIQFGPGSVIYLVVTALIAFAAYYTQANLLFWALGLVVGALAVSLLSALITLKGIEIHRLTPPRGVADEPLVLRYHLVNRSRLAWFSVEIIESWGGRWRDRRRAGTVGEDPPRLKGRPFGWVLHVGPGQTIQAEAPCWPRRRGPLRFEKIMVRTGFPFGIIRKAVEFQQAGEALIYPPLRRLNRQAALSLSSTNLSSARHADRGGGMEEFFGLRPYRPGDNYKLIDWKHSARSSNLVSREMARPRPPRIMILLELSGPDASAAPQPPAAAPARWADAQEEAISLAGSLIREAYLHGIHVGLTIAGVRGPALPMHNSHSHRQHLLDTLARLDLTQSTHDRPTPPAQPTVVIRPKLLPDDQGGYVPGAEMTNVSGNGRRAADLRWATGRPISMRGGPAPRPATHGG